ncbi:MAG: hypothetical protein HOL85_15455 [Rhodospirillaceae bacterium]|mgnify:FL=1|jgi:hypothetical protein|nr:hypothetical protein [Planctomycetaceae bacterium]MBT5266233.1 hypothetical protein [Rhodospirillaceae bacterium]
MAGFSEHQILIEFIPMGKYVKVSAVDPISLVEVSIVGDPRSGTEALKRTAARKLRYVLEKNTGDAAKMGHAKGRRV